MGCDESAGITSRAAIHLDCGNNQLVSTVGAINPLECFLEDEGPRFAFNRPKLIRL